jgi:hypothetical protein
MIMGSGRLLFKIILLLSFRVCCWFAVGGVGAGSIRKKED